MDICVHATNAISIVSQLLCILCQSVHELRHISSCGFARTYLASFRCKSRGNCNNFKNVSLPYIHTYIYFLLQPHLLSIWACICKRFRRDRVPHFLTQSCNSLKLINFKYNFIHSFGTHIHLTTRQSNHSFPFKNFCHIYRAAVSCLF